MKKIWLILIACFVGVAHAELHISVDGAKSDPTPIAVTDFEDHTSMQLGNLIPQIIHL